MDKNLAIIDLETTGGSAKREKIIEIAIAIFDGEKIIDSFETLIHPERSIPVYITRITGIDNSMIKDSPKFYEVAKKIVEITEDCIFVAHNVRFDYNFITEEFKRLGFTYSRKQLCTIKIFRKFFPGLKSYSLGNLIKEFNIPVNSRHRAMSDVEATLDIFKLGLKLPNSDKILSNNFGIEIKETPLPLGINQEDIFNLPELTGVYYFLDMFDNIVYIGKSINIKKRVKQHFQKINPKSNKFYNTVRKIEYKLTGSELVAFLKEAEDIKKYKPPINKALRKDQFPYSIYFENDQNDYICFKIERTKLNKTNLLSSFHSKFAAKNFLDIAIRKYKLCKKISGSEKSEGSCFDYNIGFCNGACIGLEKSNDYNKRASELIQNNKYFEEDTFVMIDQGRHNNEVSVIFVENNNYAGYTFHIKEELVINSIKDVKKIIEPKLYDQDFNQIVRRFINNSIETIIFNDK